MATNSTEISVRMLKNEEIGMFSQICANLGWDVKEELVREIYTVFPEGFQVAVDRENKILSKFNLIITIINIAGNQLKQNANDSI